MVEDYKGEAMHPCAYPCAQIYVEVNVYIYVCDYVFDSCLCPSLYRSQNLVPYLRRRGTTIIAMLHAVSVNPSHSTWIYLFFLQTIEFLSPAIRGLMAGNEKALCSPPNVVLGT